MDWTPIIISIISGIFAVVSIILGLRKDRASVAQIYEDMASQQAEKIRELYNRIESAEATYRDAMKKQQEVYDAELKRQQLLLEGQQQQISNLEQRVEEYEAGITLLIAQLRERDIKPIWKPSNSKFIE